MHFNKFNTHSDELVDAILVASSAAAADIPCEREYNAMQGHSLICIFIFICSTPTKTFDVNNDNNK